MREGRDLVMPECGDPVSGRSLVSMLMSSLRVCEFLPRLLVSRQVLLLSVLLAHTMGMGGGIV
jgi:hypothetical protein